MDWRAIYNLLIANRIPVKEKLDKLGRRELIELCNFWNLSPVGRKELLVEKLCEQAERNSKARALFLMRVAADLLFSLTIVRFVIIPTNLEVPSVVGLIAIATLFWMFCSFRWDEFSQMGVYKSRVGEMYRVKRENFEQFIIRDGTSLSNFINENYGSDRFENSSIRISEFFTRLIHDELYSDERAFLDARMRRVAPVPRAGRSVLEYGTNLVFGWFSEDYIRNKIRETTQANLDCRLIGVDANRNFVTSPDANPDLEISLTDSPTSYIRIDVFADYMGEGSRRGSLDLKGGKLRNLRDGTTDCVVAIDILHDTYLVFDRYSIDGDGELTPNPRYSSEAMSVDIGDSMSLDQLILELERRINAVGSRPSQEEE